MTRISCIALATCFACVAAAQSVVRPQPTDSKAAVSVPAYDSAFKDYRPYVDPEISRWREVNQEVGRLNGHVGHVPQRPGVEAKPDAKPPAQGGHGAHK